MKKKKTLVLGASENPARTSYLAINRLKIINTQLLLLVKKQVLWLVLPSEPKRFSSKI